MDEANFFDEDEQLLNNRYDPIKEKSKLVASAYRHNFGIKQDDINKQDKKRESMVDYYQKGG